jgi:hypothetical protein
MLDLMFAGHPDEAYDFLNQVWPEGKAGKSIAKRRILIIYSVYRYKLCVVS